MKKNEINNPLDEALARLKKKYGAGVVTQMDNEDAGFKVEAIPTGCFALDDAFGCSGLPRGRMIEIFGQESSGKSVLSMFFIAQIQRTGGKAALIDAEFAFDGDFARAIGVDTEKLLVAQPGTLEEAMDVLRELVESKAFDIIVLDSVAALVPKSELEGEMLRDSMAVQARLLGKALRILTPSVAKSKTVCIFVNQTRSKVGVYFGQKETTPGGKALKFFSSVRINIQKGKKIEEKEVQVGNWLVARIVKNKVGFPWKKAEFELYYTRGIDLVGASLDYGTEKQIVEKLGNTYSFQGKKIGVGRDAAKSFLEKDEAAYGELLKEIKVLREKE